MSVIDVVTLVFRPGSPYFEESSTDPAGFIERREGRLHEVAWKQLHESRRLPLALGSPWHVVTPGDLDVDLVRDRFGSEVAGLVAQACAEHPGAVVVWKAVEVVPKGVG